MKTLFLLFLAVSAYAEQLESLLSSIPSDVLSPLVEKDSKSLKSENEIDPFKITEETGKLTGKPMSVVPPVGAPLAGKALKAAAIASAPVKKIAAKKVAATKGLAVPKLKAAAALKKKPKVYSLKPIVHVIEKPVPVYHKVPVPKKVLVPKFYPVMKPIPVPKVIPVPFKVPIKKVIPKIVKIPKAVPIPKIVPIKKPVPIPIPYPVPKFKKFPVPKPVPYAKYIPIPIPKKVPKFVPVPVKKIIKVPKPYYVPVKVPYFTASYVKSPKVVDVPDIKKFPSGGKMPTFKKPTIALKSEGNKEEEKFLQSILGGTEGGKPVLGDMGGKSLFEESIGTLGSEDKELMKLLAGTMPGEKSKL